ncbi:class I SAM-dependent methyltransferase [Streptomyces beijiangensis]|uniref:Methyltransferase domain-containing protein n=1 Tax=Streptomyces beijiangensis TaxID=163361 RepID=A0A939JE65_9ACTN|nr:class I SAM-dependent methyltransferase [Streptomyces beijiangensis]MBO0512761.1 methyltransferase domain-containing protein [Streptomyces beijiangensis]
MANEEFTDPALAALYDTLNSAGPRDDFAFYLPLVMSAEAVLDVGCGTGTLLHEARRAGHTGRLVGLDPAPGMLEIARGRTDIQWMLGGLGSAAWDREFDLIVMSGHAFQVFLEDDELRSALRAIRDALQPGGRFAFETRNPAVRAWEGWHEEYSSEVRDADGGTVRTVCEVETPVTGDRVSFTHTYTGPAWPTPRVSRSTLRFLAPEALASYLTEAGLVTVDQYGDWDRTPLTSVSPEIITVAVRQPELPGSTKPFS